jgi:hypothetical protein
VNTKNNRSVIILIAVLAFAVLAYFGISFIRNANSAENGEGLHHFSVKSFQEPNGWAYRIYQDTIPVIEQKFVPGVQGNSGFKTETEALKTGNLVKTKLNRGIFPPTVSRQELDSLGVSY